MYDLPRPRIPLGVDLAAGRQKTTACRSAWGEGRADVALPRVGLDATLLQLIPQAKKVGFDSPFGWPDEFVAAVRAHRASRRWLGPHREWLSYRETDRVAAERVPGCRPLSVSAGKIAACAMRCAHLLCELTQDGTPVDRTGVGHVADVYPAGALRSWGLPASGYKQRAAIVARRALVAQLLTRASWLYLAPPVQSACEEIGRALDAFIAARVARAAASAATHRLAAGVQAKRASRGDWIHLSSGGLDDLCAPSPRAASKCAAIVVGRPEEAP